jgi:hypothetical protein
MKDNIIFFLTLLPNGLLQVQNLYSVELDAKIIVNDGYAGLLLMFRGKLMHFRYSYRYKHETT